MPSLCRCIAATKQICCFWRVSALNPKTSVVSDMHNHFHAGGIYNLPSHLSPGARDLIPRMLLVDPLKRITIPEIRWSSHRSVFWTRRNLNLQHSAFAAAIHSTFKMRSRDSAQAIQASMVDTKIGTAARLHCWL